MNILSRMSRIPVTLVMRCSRLPESGVKPLALAMGSVKPVGISNTYGRAGHARTHTLRETM